MFACGINAPLELIEKGENKNCRVYSVKENQCVCDRIPIYHKPYVHPAYNPQALWEHYVPVTWKIIRYDRVQLVRSLCLMRPPSVLLHYLGTGRFSLQLASIWSVRPFYQDFPRPLIIITVSRSQISLP